MRVGSAACWRAAFLALGLPPTAVGWPGWPDVWGGREKRGARSFSAAWTLKRRGPPRAATGSVAIAAARTHGMRSCTERPRARSCTRQLSLRWQRTRSRLSGRYSPCLRRCDRSGGGGGFDASSSEAATFYCRQGLTAVLSPYKGFYRKYGSLRMRSECSMGLLVPPGKRGRHQKVPRHFCGQRAPAPPPRAEAPSLKLIIALSCRRPRRWRTQHAQPQAPASQARQLRRPHAPPRALRPLEMPPRGRKVLVLGPTAPHDTPGASASRWAAPCPPTVSSAPRAH